MRLNLGCGTRMLPEHVNVDRAAKYRPDVVSDIRRPLPFAAQSLDGVVASHILEHIGPEYLDVMREIHRVCKPGAAVEVIVPLYSSPKAWADPTHVRAFSPTSFAYFDNRWSMGAEYGIRGLFYQESAQEIHGCLYVQMIREPRDRWVQ